VQSRVVVAVPIDAVIGQIHRIIIPAVGHDSVLPIRAPPVRVVILAGKMETTTADHGDRFAKCGGNGGQKLFVSVERHERIPSPMRGYECEPATRSVTDHGKWPAWQHATPAGRGARGELAT